ncbi:MAG TPA: hypothetical protein DC049_02075 [Spirochaetia bacterium]|nr:hypothetical protein [Spirochaetia bacterium]
MIYRRACEELILTDHKIREIAALFGFNDEFYFSRFFHKMSGMPPREYRSCNTMRQVAVLD